MYIDPNDIENKNTMKCEILITDTWKIFKKKDDTRLINTDVIYIESVNLMLMD